MGLGVRVRVEHRRFSVRVMVGLGLRLLMGKV